VGVLLAALGGLFPSRCQSAACGAVGPRAPPARPMSAARTIPSTIPAAAGISSKLASPPPGTNCAGTAGRRHDRFRALVCARHRCHRSANTRRCRDRRRKQDDRSKVNSICRGCLSHWLRFVRDLVATRWIPAADLQRFCHESVILSGSDWMRENGHVAQNGDRIDGDSRRGNARA
jgi:hypothetical protein